jgi:hypothetical protein
MTDTSKPAPEAPPSVTAIEDSELKGNHADMSQNQQENAVGYSEYLEARDIEFSDAEVRLPCFPLVTIDKLTV